MELYDLTRHPRFQEFLANMLMTVKQFESLDDEMKLILLRNFKRWLERMGEGVAGSAIIKCPYCGRAFEIKISIKRLD